MWSIAPCTGSPNCHVSFYQDINYYGKLSLKSAFLSGFIFHQQVDLYKTLVMEFRCYNFKKSSYAA